MSCKLLVWSLDAALVFSSFAKSSAVFPSTVLSLDGFISPKTEQESHKNSPNGDRPHLWLEDDDGG